MSVTTQSRPFLSPALKARLGRRAAEILALVLTLIGLTLLIALVSYHPSDPSFNTASNLPVRNLLGPPGAVLADGLLQGFGLLGALPALVLFGWSFVLINRGVLRRWRWRALATLIAMPCLAGALGAWHATVSVHFPAYAGLGGVVGALLGQTGSHLGQSNWGAIGGLVAPLIALVIGLPAALYAIGLTFGEWRAAGSRAARVAQGSVRGARGGAGSVSAWLAPVLASAPLDRASSSGAPANHGRVGDGAGMMHGIEASLFDPPDQPSPANLRGAEMGLSAVKPGTDAAKVRLTRAAPVKKAPPKQERLPLPDAHWRLPPLELLRTAPPRGEVGPSAEALQANARLLETVLADYGVQGRIVEIRPGPVVTLYELEPAPGIRSARVIGLADDIARSLSALAVRIATVQGRNVIGIEVPNAKRETVFLSELMEVAEWDNHSGKLALALGKDIGGIPVIGDLSRMPHLLIAGTTGSGKSVGINAMILSLLYRLSPEECRLILIDPKMLELSVYEGIPHLLAPVVTEPAKAVAALKWVVREMERRYRSMSQLSVRNIAGYNERVNEALARGEVVTRRVQTGFDEETGRPILEDQPIALQALPLIVVVIDEMADLMMVAGKEIEAAVQRLAQMARAAGIHVIMATQRPSVDVITGTIKANFPTRISFQVISKFDSRTILGEQGAEQLLGMGDLLYMVGGGRITRVHGPFVTDREVEDVVAFLREQGEPDYVEAVTEAVDDDTPALPGLAAAESGEGGLYQQAVAVVAREGKASTSFLQRHLQIGYNRAAKLIEQMEKAGVVSPANHVGKREVLIAVDRDQ
ncbi:MAG TPA: DNA translocase FtsK 4TM domain-containing protein [Acidiphilium sp.]|nr:MAG: cell division protein FtsK [Acidiphilium sp. 21-60-14]OYV91381.1 MAG: cell division protein FtsK [Acidiphilium sp. 37-60-79]OZB41376.1 MAG: cell division protein FtsK [Acidiphilium sp. 34-60-192]HQT87289.1 DNA translocase FtsK 4TM domain-containing protein [Acidiphilium sp.]HQU23216.1 DNA translocase FtsK 4TM domain-containing protein [Acidiphilium sp.]